MSNQNGSRRGKKIVYMNLTANWPIDVNYIQCENDDIYQPRKTWHDFGMS